MTSQGYPYEIQAMTDPELTAAVRQRLIEDGSVPMEELSVSAEAGRVIVSGALPSREALAALRRIVRDDMGVAELVELLKIDRTLWQRPDRAPGLKEPGPSDAEILLEGEPVSEDVDAALENGTSVAPADTLVPDNKPRT